MPKQASYPVFLTAETYSSYLLLPLFFKPLRDGQLIQLLLEYLLQVNFACLL